MPRTMSVSKSSSLLDRKLMQGSTSGHTLSDSWRNWQSSARLSSLQPAINVTRTSCSTISTHKRNSFPTDSTEAIAGKPNRASTSRILECSRTVTYKISFSSITQHTPTFINSKMAYRSFLSMTIRKMRNFCISFPTSKPSSRSRSHINCITP